MKSESYKIVLPMGVCRVAFTDSEGISHAVEVQADSNYEAVALAVVESGAMTRQWLSPAGITKHQARA